MEITTLTEGTAITIDGFDRIRGQHISLTAELATDAHLNSLGNLQFAVWNKNKRTFRSFVMAQTAVTLA